MILSLLTLLSLGGCHGYLINKEKVVIYPDLWFGPNNIDKSTADLFPPEWRMINEH